MIVINIREINVKSMSGNSGIYIGSNFDPNRVTFTKLNANIFGNNNKNNLNIIIDNDGLDFVVGVWIGCGIGARFNPVVAPL